MSSNIQIDLCSRRNLYPSVFSPTPTSDHSLSSTFSVLSAGSWGDQHQDIIGFSRIQRPKEKSKDKLIFCCKDKCLFFFFFNWIPRGGTLGEVNPLTEQNLEYVAIWKKDNELTSSGSSTWEK